MNNLSDKTDNFILSPTSNLIKAGISLITAIKNRKDNFEEALCTWLNLEEIDEIIIVDWDSEESLVPLIEKHQNGKIWLAEVKDQPNWILSFAYNLAARLTTRTQLLKIDADIKLSRNFFNNHVLRPGIFFTGNWKIARNDNERHQHGTCFTWRTDFFSVNGYNEFIKSYGWDDIDLYSRLEAIKLTRYDFNLDDLYHIPHENRTTSQNQLTFLTNINDTEKSLVNALINKNLSSIYKPWSDKEQQLPFTIKPSGSHRYICIPGTDINTVSSEVIEQCEVQAIIQRLREKKIGIPEYLLSDFCRKDLILLFNLVSLANNLDISNQLFNLLNKIITLVHEHTTNQQWSILSQKIENAQKKATELEQLSNYLNGEIDSLKSNLKQSERIVNSKNDQIKRIYNSYSWKFGHAIFASIGSMNYLFRPEKKPSFLSWNPQKKINLTDQIGDYYGKHRSGWSFAIGGLASLHKPDGILVDAFVERTFGWHPDGIKPHLTPWIGFVHVPPKVPKWFYHNISNEEIFALTQWKESLPQCKGLYTLSNYHKNQLERVLSVPINSLFHPTETPMLKWNWQAFISNREKKVIQVGYWLRKLYSIHLLQAPTYKKLFIIKDDNAMNYLLKVERDNYILKDQLTEGAISSVEHISFQSNEDYDMLLSRNIIYLDLYDSSANNAIIECIVRNSPVLVNPIEPVIEYLGSDYPFYFSNHVEASEKLNNFDLIKKTHEYLKDLPIKNRLTLKHFRKSLLESSIYKNL